MSALGDEEDERVYGFVDSDLNVVIPPVWDRVIAPFDAFGKAWVYLEGHTFQINSVGCVLEIL